MEEAKSRIIFFITMLCFLFPFLSHGANPSGVSVSVSPSSGKNGDLVTVQVAIGGSSEGIRFITENLSYVRGYHEHCGFCMGTPCLNSSNDVITCTDVCYGYGYNGIGCSYDPINEFSNDWFGPPTLEYELSGCGTATVTPSYYDGNHGGPYLLETIKIKIEDGIQADFDPPAHLCVDEEVQFTNTSCGGEEFHWQFGDGAESDEENPTHRYDTAGTFNVTLTVTDTYDSDTITKSVEVDESCATIKGTTFDGKSGLPLPGVGVTASGTAPAGTSSTATGSYEMKVDADTSYQLEAVASGYQDTPGPLVTLASGDEYTWNAQLPRLSPPDLDPASKRGDQADNVEDPVNPVTGNYFQERELFSFPGRRGLGLSFSVSYNSAVHDQNGVLGYGWTHSYNLSIEEEDDLATLTFGNGHKEFYRWNETTQLYNPVNCVASVVLTKGSPEGWEATSGGGIVAHFDGQGRLTSITDRNANTIFFSHSTHLDQIVDTQGRTITFTYSNDRLAAVDSPLVSGGHTVEFSFNGAGDLISIADPRHNSRLFSYDTEHRLQTETDRRGKLVFTNAYDSQGRVERQTAADGGVTRFSYGDNDLGTEVTITNPVGQRYSYQYDTGNNLIGIADSLGRASSFTVGQNGNTTTSTDKKNQASAFRSSALGYLTSFTDRLGISSQLSYNSDHQLTRVSNDLGQTGNITYDGNGNVVTVEDPNHDFIRYWHNSDGQPYYISYPAFGSIWEITYTGNGLVSTVKNRDNKTVTYHHDPAGRLTGIDYPDSLGSVTAGYDANSNLQWLVSPLGHRTEYTYNENDQLLTRTFVPTGAVTSYSYDDAGQLTAITDAGGNTQSYTYDTLGNVLTETDGDGVVTRYTYDDRNQLQSVQRASGNTSTLGYDANGNPAWVRNNQGGEFTRSYDQGGRLTTITEPTGERLTYQWNQGSITSDNAAGLSTRYTLDKSNNIVRETAANGSVNYNRNPAGRILSIDDEENNLWRYSYDYQGRLATVTDPLGKKQSRAYDAVGNLVAITKRSGESLSWNYDLDGNETGLLLPDGESITRSYSYDATAGTTTVTVAENSGTTTLVYDRLDRLTSKTDVFGNTIGFAYTPGGRVSHTTYPGNKDVTYVHDSFGRLERIEDWAGKTTTYSYDSLDRVQRIQLPNGSRTQYEYDAANRIKKIAHTRSDGSDITTIRYQRDKTGRIIRADSTNDPASAAADRTTTYSYNEANRVMTSTTDGVVTSYQFDDNGNCIRRETAGAATTFDYDGRNRLVAATSETGIVTNYDYDFADNQVAKIYNGSEERYQRVEGRVYTRLDGANSPTDYQIHGRGGMLYSLDSSGGVTVYHGDELGNIVAETDDLAAVQRRASYDPYGAKRAETGTASPFGYLGGRSVITDENNIQHMRASSYDPNLSRFMAEGPERLAARARPYSVGGGDPVNQRIQPGSHSNARMRGAGLPPDFSRAAARRTVGPTAYRAISEKSARTKAHPDSQKTRLQQRNKAVAEMENRSGGFGGSRVTDPAKGMGGSHSGLLEGIGCGDGFGIGDAMEFADVDSGTTHEATRQNMMRTADRSRARLARRTMPYRLGWRDTPGPNYGNSPLNTYSDLTFGFNMAENPQNAANQFNPGATSYDNSLHLVEASSDGLYISPVLQSTVNKITSVIGGAVVTPFAPGWGLTTIIQGTIGTK